jgi:tetratricopeptide (TPR) repeat protein
MYQRALLFDPKLYEAALFVGDCYFSSADQKNAVEWFSRAVAIDVDRETAYRYWGDALMKQGKPTEAGEKFVEAYIAEPYNRLARAAFLNWGEKAHLTLAHPNVELPANVIRKEAGTTITLDPDVLKKDDKSGSSAAWLTYGIVRAGWLSSQFATNYPNEKNYRHSLKEEAAALRGALAALNNQKIHTNKIDPSLQLIRKLDKEGLLEAFILLALPDEGIVNDFPDYRRTHAAELRRYVKQYVLTGGGN